MSEPPACFIHAIETTNPPHSLSAGECIRRMPLTCRSERAKRLLRRVVQLTGIDRRYMAALDFQSPDDGPGSMYRPAQIQPDGPGMTARSEAFEAASAPLVRRVIERLPEGFVTGIRSLVTVTCTNASSPGLDRAVVAAAPVPATADRWNLGFMGCSAGLAALRLVHQLSPGRDALIVACELSSLHLQYTDEVDQLTANVLFADGCAAVALSSRPSPTRVQAARCVVLPEAADQMVWFAADTGLRLRLSQELPDTLAAALPSAVNGFLDAHGLRRTDVEHWLVHPGGPQILDAAECALELPPTALDVSRAVLREYGNMSSVTIFFILKRLLATRPEGHCMALAFGPGLTVEMVLLELIR